MKIWVIFSEDITIASETHVYGHDTDDRDDAEKEDDSETKFTIEG